MSKGIKNFCPNCDEEYDGAPDGYSITLLPCLLHEHAKELLEACREVIKACDGGDWAKAIEMSRAAFEKIEGKPVTRG